MLDYSPHIARSLQVGGLVLVHQLSNYVGNSLGLFHDKMAASFLGAKSAFKAIKGK